MIVLRPGRPDDYDLLGDMRLILAWLRDGYLLFARKHCGRLEVWSDAPSRKAMDLNPADAARLLARGLIEEDVARSTEQTSAYRLTDDGRRAIR